jgi:UDP-N-acetylmuramoyl-L-alanyl-D-glutamate--2,6-diaminopimelate ligase
VMLSQLLPDMQVPVVAIHGISEDSRRVKSGDLFCAVAGEQTDGRNYIKAAIGNGAVAVLSESPLPEVANQIVPEVTTVPIVPVEGLHSRMSEIADRFYGHPSEDLTVFAVTGTNGKTSFTQLLAQALSSAGVACGMIGTMGSGLPGALSDPGLTTPSAIDIQRKLRELVDSGCEAVVLEASSHGLVQGRLGNVSVGTAVLTNITHDHLDYHGTFESYRKAKELLFHIGSVSNAVINLDDDFASDLAAGLGGGVRVIGYSLKKETDVSLMEAAATPLGVEVSISVSGDIIKARLPLFGSFNIQNVLAVVATLVAMEWGAPQIEASLKKLSPVAGRMDVLRSAGKPTIIVDYAHTPDALEKALTAVREHFPNRHISCVFGCGGDRDATKRPVMGEIASRYADRVVLTSDNPRSENPESIIHEIQAGVDAADLHINADRREAIREAIQLASENEIVVIAGKGHEDYQELASGRVPFSDYEVIDEVMSAGAVTNGEEK